MGWQTVSVSVQSW